MEEQVQALSARLAQLETEKSGLAARNAALETALSSARDSEATLVSHPPLPSPPCRVLSRCSRHCLQAFHNS